MSRIGKVPVAVPKEVKAKIDGNSIYLEGPKGKLDITIPNGINVELKDDNFVINRLLNAKQHRANHGTVRANLANMVEGVSKGHKKELELNGIGFRGQLKGKTIVFNLGFSHPVEFDLPSDVTVTLPTQTSIIIEGSDKMRVGQVAAKIRGLKPVEPYKGKGFKYIDEVVRRKQGKSVSK